MITQRAILVGIVGFFLYLIAFVNTLPTFYALTWLSVGILVSSFGIGLLSLVGLDCVWHVTLARASEGGGEVVIADDGRGTTRQALEMEGPLVEVSLANGGTLNKIGVLLEVRLQSLVQDEVIARRFLMEALPSGASLEAALPLGQLPRGRYRVLEVCLIGSDVLGLFRMQKRIAARDQFKAVRVGQVPPAREIGASAAAPQPLEAGSNDLVIGPGMVAMRDAATLLGVRSGALGRNQMLGQSDELRSTRPYVAGDDLRRVHWKSTARHGQLVVKEFYQTTQHECLVIWDGAEDTTWGKETATTTEYGLRLVASLCRVLDEAGRPYTLLRLDKEPLQLATAEQGRGVGHMLARVIEVLADAEAERATSLSNALGRLAGNLPPDVAVFLVTASLAPDLPQVARRWRGSGAQLHVALVDAAAFLDSKSSSRMRHAPFTPHQRWVSGLDDTPGETPVTAAAYQAQAEALAAAGSLVVTLAPAPDAPREFAPPVRHALRALLESSSSHANHAAH